MNTVNCGNGIVSIECDTIGYGVEQSLIALNKFGYYNKRENQDKMDIMKEMRLCLTIDYPFANPFISRCIPTDLKGLIKYDEEFLDGTADNLGWEYTYHSLYSKYYDKLLAELKRCNTSRRGCIALGQDDINFGKNPPCLQMIMLDAGPDFKRNRRVDMTVIFRSNDAVKAFPMNIHAITMLFNKIIADSNYKLKMGKLIYIANNFHAYSRDFKKLDNYCKIFETGSEKRRFWTVSDYLEKTRELKGETNED